ncbi:MAG: dihydrolipoamide acetyltransferase family protein, partial [Spirochaetia bacterium]
TSESSGKESIIPPSDEGTEAPQRTKKPREKSMATPVARSYAKELGVDINEVEGTGTDGRVMKADIFKHYEAGKTSRSEAADSDTGRLESKKGADKAAATERTEEVQLSSIRKTIAKNMLESTRSAAHMSLFEEVEISELVAVRKKYKDIFAEQGIRLTYLPFFLKALTRALADFPVLNSEMDIEHNKLIYKNYYNIGVAVDTKDGLVVPVIRDVDTKDISQIAGEIEEKAQKAKDRKLSLDDFRDGTFTITSYGSIGGLWGTAVINYPQAGILGIGRIHEQPVVRDGEVAVGTVLPVSLTVDHRIVDGGSSTRFMNSFLSYVSSPVDMFIR